MANDAFLNSLGAYVGPVEEGSPAPSKAPDEFLNTLGTYVGPAKEVSSPSPALTSSPSAGSSPIESIPGFQYYPRTDEAPEHYEGPNGEWVLPENLRRAYGERIAPEVERQYKQELPGTSFVREAVHSASVGHGPMLEALGAKALSAVGLAPERTYEEERAISRSLLDKYREDHANQALAAGVAGGVAGMAALPEILPAKAAAALSYANPLTYLPRVQQWARMAPRAGEAAFDAAKAAEDYWVRQAVVKGAGAGVPYGAAYAAGESNAPVYNTEHGVPLPNEEYASDVLRGGLTGGATGAALGPAFAGAFRGARNAYNYFTDRPAYIAEKAANAFSAAGTTPEAVINELVPPPTPALANIPQENLAYAVRQRQLGQSISDIATEIGVDAKDLTPYFTKNKASIESPQNILAASRLAAGDKYKLAPTPMELRARADVALQGPSKAGEINPESELRGTLNDQQARLATRIDDLVGSDVAKAEKTAQNKIDVESKKLYGEIDREGIQTRAARQLHESNVNLLNGVVDNSRRNLDRALEAQQNFARSLEESKFSRMARSPEELTQIDEANAQRQQLLQDRVASAKQRLETSIDSADAARKLLPPSPDSLNVTDVLRKGRQTAREDFGSNTDSWNRFHNAIDQFFETTPVPEGTSSLGRLESRPDYSRPVRDINSFQEARQKLNLLISRERRSQDGDKYLVKRLTEFKNELNQAAWDFSPKLKEADSKWAEGVSSLEILEEAQHAALNLGTKASEQLAYFKELGKEQKKLFQIGFAKAIKDKILNAPEGSKQVIAISESPGKKKVIFDILGKAQAEKLFDTLDRERALFVSGAHALSGSRTAPMMENLKAYNDLAHGAAAIMTGAPHSAIERGRNLLGYALRSRSAAQRNAFNMSSEPGQAIYNAYEARNAFQKAMVQKQMLDEAARVGALVGQGEIRSMLPQAQP
jgi:hypothetical protein